jgi:hypothetical protein
MIHRSMAVPSVTALEERRAIETEVTAKDGSRRLQAGGAAARGGVGYLPTFVRQDHLPAGRRKPHVSQEER